MPLAIGFMVESDGRLPGGQPLQEVIEQVDDQTDSYPLYYLINCAHPSHFEQVLLEGSGPWRERIRGLRVSASACRHDEPAQTATPDSGDPEAEVLAHHYVTLKQQFGHLNIFGGCWGGDPVAAMARALRGMV